MGYGFCRRVEFSMENKQTTRRHIPEDDTLQNVWYIRTTNCVEGNNNKILPYTQYDAEVQHF
jgi:hypothetical protein